ncbi:MAG: hypothetical protein AVDCRST_MAG43-2141 [uncultured Thermomicrobiales bacterium]|uniref:DUF2085 domain-containing protein n=1 Tax=uncultured Thermomicrobiales bacterium TaxID=1645740 RepID=A0A6J4UYM6_9BACT|nr:MAG: hypothetical protein AVDCRST_MAG43-2141 [uncultured Thermomicrobiales bacterium]
MIREMITSYWLWFGIIITGALIFTAYPGGYASTSHHLLHGLCAQTPSHTLLIGNKPLPFDARMTGIYGGLLVGMATIVIRGKLFHYGSPSRPVIVGLATCVIAMAIDGTNSLLHDLALWHPYPPANILRVITGYLAGIALSVMLTWLLASSVWNLGRPGHGVGSIPELLVPVLFLVPYVGLLLAAPAVMHFPLSIALVTSAWITVSIIMLVIVLLVFRLDEQVRTVRHLHVPGAVAALLGVGVMLALAGLRFWMEQTFGISNAMM